MSNDDCNIIHMLLHRQYLNLEQSILQVGDPIKDHNCWERPEDMDTDRTVYTVEAPNPASDVAGEIAAALAASSIAFRSSDPGYAETLLRTASRAFEYADAHRGAYSDNSDIREGICPFYCDFDGYQVILPLLFLILCCFLHLIHIGFTMMCIDRMNCSGEQHGLAGRQMMTLTSIIYMTMAKHLVQRIIQMNSGGTTSMQV